MDKLYFAKAEKSVWFLCNVRKIWEKRFLFLFSFYTENISTLQTFPHCNSGWGSSICHNLTDMLVKEISSEQYNFLSNIYFSVYLLFWFIEINTNPVNHFGYPKQYILQYSLHPMPSNHHTKTNSFVPAFHPFLQLLKRSKGEERLSSMPWGRI